MELHYCPKFLIVGSENGQDVIRPPRGGATPEHFAEESRLPDFRQTDSQQTRGQASSSASSGVRAIRASSLRDSQTPILHRANGSESRRQRVRNAAGRAAM